MTHRRIRAEQCAAIYFALQKIHEAEVAIAAAAVMVSRDARFADIETERRKAEALRQSLAALAACIESDPDPPHEHVLVGGNCTHPDCDPTRRR